MWYAIGICLMLGCLAIMWCVIVPMAFYQAYHAPLPHQKELDELAKAYEKLAEERAKLKELLR